MTTAFSQLAITGIGMVSSLGLDAGVACAAARAGIAQPSELEYAIHDRVEREDRPIIGYSIGAYALGFTELGRLVRLGSLGLRNLIQRGGITAKEIEGTPILLNLPSGYYHAEAQKKAQSMQPKGAAGESEDPSPPSFDELKGWYEAGIVPKIFAALQLRDPSSAKVFFEDESGIASVLQAAHDELSGRASQCVVGGVDSLVDPYWLEVCDQLGVLKTPLRSVGFMPGEAAAFLRLELVATARRRGATILATIDGVSRREEKNARFGDKPPTGIALSEAILEAKASARNECSTLYADINGDVVRAADWGNAQVRIRPHFGKRRDVVPAMSFGATRGAAGFVAACMAARAFETGQSKSASVVAWVASDHGGRGSFAMSRASG